MIGCNHEEIETKQNNEQEFRLNIEDARIIASNLNLKNPYESSMTEPNLRKASNNISEESTISDGDTPNYYVFNYTENGSFSIISADF